MCRISVLLCTYISLGLVFVPKLRFICRVPPSADEAHPNGNTMMRGLSKSDQKRYEHLRHENEVLQKQIDEKEKRIRQCKERLECLLNKEDDLLSISGAANNTRSVSGRIHSHNKTPWIARYCWNWADTVGIGLYGKCFFRSISMKSRRKIIFDANGARDDAIGSRGTSDDFMELSNMGIAMFLKVMPKMWIIEDE
ncbi:hypothetical protein ANCDUO_04103 [Ancylostoma duodenale]|uniref:Uncharacterized protein n=1 Tax=Ancylostoma duodenale TaxID=51022 RepID=A0A0C2DS23_9BILA|nr:hypothetical protein ANCDUO_04103 [Ancylostoma duodenale]